TILVVDDELFNLELVKEYLSESEADIETVCVNNGEEALSILQESPDKFSVVVLDRMMPGIDGMEVLSRIKADSQLCRLPVIMQTAKTGKESMLEGLNAGAYYYLAKPYDQQTLVAIVSTAIRDYQQYIEIQNSLKQTSQSLVLMDKGKFSFKSIDDGRNLAALLANACPNPDAVMLGLTELMINAVEHGNLGINYDEKSKLNAEGDWENEVERRLELPLYKDKIVTIEFSRGKNDITFLIIDQGAGFDWNQYMEICPSRAFDSHGRGIAMANSISFSQVEYLDIGNKVCAKVSLQ
ncbi:MAG: response regulator, partial [Gammaproteobacteria bacterium]|nr:response regulator [Gammaproteobacteria bacterium]